MKAGDVFQLDGVADIHTWVVISDPAVDASRILIVNFTSYDRFEDQACILDMGDHPFIRHRTCVNYPRANAKSSNAQLDELRSRGRLLMLDPVTPELLQRMREGAAASLKMPLELGEILFDQNLVD
jgi:hypothetical protein